MNDQRPPKQDGTSNAAPGPTGTDPTIRYAEGSSNDISMPLLSIPLGVESTIPKRLGKYEVHGRIGSGGMGVVLKSFDPDLERMVAIKVLQPHLAQSQVARRRFQREARAAAAISHENVLTIHAVEEQDQFPFLVMEYVSGSSLKEYISSRGKLTSLEIIRLSAQIAKGLEAAHAQGVIHRDIKPGNVMLHEGGTRVRLTDFGLARVAYDNSDLTSHDQTVGTPAYMSPEQVRGGPIDARSDLFGLGCVIYCMATGQSPFHGGNHAETVHRILDFRPPPLHQTNPLISTVVSDLVDHLLAKRPEDRYQSAAEVAEVLTHLVSVINQTATDELERALGREVAPTPAAELTPAGQVKSGPRTRRPALAWLAGLLATASAVAALVIWLNRPPNAGDASLVGAARVEPIALTRLAEVVVGAGPGATASTLAEALGRVAPSGVIQIPAGVYEEALNLSELESLTIRGAGDAVIRPLQTETGESTVLTIKNCRDIRIHGLRLESTGKDGRAVTIQGAVSGIDFEDCGFLHAGPTSKLTLVSVKAAGGEGPGQAPVKFRRCRFERGSGTGYCLTVESREGPAVPMECTDCRFRAPDALLHFGGGCEKAVVQRNLFLAEDTAVLLEYRPWKGSEQIDISNNTFLGMRHWLSWMNSTSGPNSASGGQGSRLVNNLILGGKRTLGPDAQWEKMLSTWTIQSNYWERDPSTTTTADRGGRLALMVDSVDVANRNDENAESFLRPAMGSPLASQGAGGDLPKFVGALEPLPATESELSPQKAMVRREVSVDVLRQNVARSSSD